MSDPSGRSVLLIDRGDLPSLVACFIQPDAGRLVLWHPGERDPAGPRRAEAVLQHAKLLDAPAHITAPTDWPEGLQGEAAGGPAIDRAFVLTQAAVLAHRLGAQRIIWPLQVGPVATDVSAAVDQATLVTELIHASAGGRKGGSSVMIDLPLIDLDEPQIVDLADDAGAPAAFWPCLAGGPEPCTVCPDCIRWMEAYERLGLPWPWTVRAAPGAA